MNLTGNTGYGVRIFNAANINEPVNIYLDDREIIRGLNYKSVSDYFSLPRNRYNIKIYNANTGELLYNQTVNIDGNKFITLSAISENGRMDLVVLEDFSVNERNKTNKRNIRKKVIDRFNNFIDVVINESGEINDDATNQLGHIIIHNGDKIKKIIDRFGNVIEVVIDNTGKIVAFVFDELSEVFEQVIIRIGDSIEKIVDEFGNVINVVVDEFDAIVGWVIDEMDVNSSTLIPQLNRDRKSVV